MKLFLATKNEGKVRELRAILKGHPWSSTVEVLSASDYPEIQDPEETGQTFAENARLKARYYAERTGLIALADDSGLVVDPLGGRPGVQSARYGKDDADRISRLLGELSHIQDIAERTAHFACAMALASADGRILLESEGRLDGYIAFEPKGTNGFGYDPIFEAPELGCRLAEASSEDKNRVSHRGRALAQLLPKLRLVLEV